MFFNAGAKTEVRTFTCHNDRFQVSARSQFAQNLYELEHHGAIHDVGFWPGQDDAGYLIIMGEFQSDSIISHLSDLCLFPLRSPGSDLFDEFFVPARALSKALAQA